MLFAIRYFIIVYLFVVFICLLAAGAAVVSSVALRLKPDEAVSKSSGGGGEGAYSYLDARCDYRMIILISVYILYFCWVSFLLMQKNNITTISR